MCGIVGLHLRNPDLHPRLGELLAGMLCEMESRGADSAGISVYGNPQWTPVGHGAVTLLDVPAPADEVAAVLAGEVGAELKATNLDTTCLVTGLVGSEALLAAAKNVWPHVAVGGFGADLAVLKGVGSPKKLAGSWGLRSAWGWQGVGHTRMATESAVTPGGAHPYAVGPGQCLVHNGSFANHATIRRELAATGVEFDSENDTEVGARFVAKRLADGDDVERALKELCATFDGFYTLLVSNRDSFAVVRDAIACKPAVIAETSDWVAVASEFRALAHLPGVEAARIWEPEPEVVYAWTRTEASA
ncbi:glutamine amidotransferase [Amycolatopsis sp. K13G38]|uniref:glutamine--fructose-6-phosphate transaminase (isomerizing) n=1 Tax=Amycolatopsis acididurans TaxID=2724524 RepID=A0ABX1JD53_9PSEU|nr:glutamine amidotransferase [Amycolatopsis acididurans]NKQ57678.1 glutamine amidotransferase [Amycolatopsis acididurans]